MKTKLVLLSLVSISLVGCGEVVNPGEVAVKVKLTGSNAGLEKAEVFNTGKVREGIDEKIYRISTAIKNYTYTADEKEGKAQDESFTFSTSNGIRVNTDVGVTYRIVDPKAFLVAYKIDDDNYQFGELKNLVRDELNRVGAKYALNDIVNSQGKSKLDEFYVNLKNSVNEKLKNNGVEITRIAFVNGFRLPKNIQDAITANQESAQNAEKAKQDLIKEKAELEVKRVRAEASKVEAATLTPLLVRKLWIDKWNGGITVVNGVSYPAEPKVEVNKQ